MKAIITLTLLGLIWVNMVAQTPQAFKYQAVARNTAGEVLVNKQVSFRISILSGGATGTAVYTETFTGKTTNAFGLVDLEIGKGTPVTGTFAGINWGTNNYFLKVEMDPNGGSAWQAMGSSQLLSVPYALYARDVENNADGDADATNELQKISISGTVLTLDKSGGSVTLPSGGTSGDNWGTQTVKTNSTLTGEGTPASPLGVVQTTLTPTWNNLLNVPVGFMDGIDNVDDGDADQTNEIQVMSLSGTILSLSKGGGTVTLPSSGGGDNWGTQAVVADATLTGNGTTATPLKIADNGITSAKILDAAIVTADLADQTVSTAKLGNLAVSADKMQNGAVITDKLANGSVTGTKIAQASATSGQVLKWDGSTWKPSDDLAGSSLWQSNGTNIYYSNGNVGIGTSEPQSQLHVNVQQEGFSAIQFTTDASGKYANDGFIIGLQYQNIFPANRYGLILNVEDAPLRIGTNSQQYQLNLLPGGNVGIGIENPGAKLDVNGQIKIRGGSPGVGKVLTSDAIGLATWQTITPNPWLISGSNIYYNAGNVGIGKDPGTDARKFQSVTGSNVAIAAENNSGDINLPALFAQNHGSGLAFISSGKIKIIDGTQGNGKVLTSDANGLATWQMPPFMNSSTDAYFTNSGNVGIGNTAPGYKLDVTGNRISLSDATGDWIALRTDGGSNDYLDLSWGGGSLVIQGATTNENILMNPSMNKVGIRTWTPQYDLDVNGNIRAIGSIYYGGTTTTNGSAYAKPDYVFKNDYTRLATEEVEVFLKENDHLPWVTSIEQEKKENGGATDMTRMAFETLESVENLQLQLIEQNKLVRSLKAENNMLRVENDMLKARDNQVINRIERLEKLVGASAPD